MFLTATPNYCCYYDFVRVLLSRCKTQSSTYMHMYTLSKNFSCSPELWMVLFRFYLTFFFLPVYFSRLVYVIYGLLRALFFPLSFDFAFSAMFAFQMYDKLKKTMQNITVSLCCTATTFSLADAYRGVDTRPRHCKIRWMQQQQKNGDDLLQFFDETLCHKRNSVLDFVICCAQNRNK